MLFTIKNRLLYALLLLATLAGAAILLRAALALHWHLDYYSALPVHVAVGLGAILTSDSLIHGLLCWRAGARYRGCYQALADCFRPQGPREIIAAGLLAGGGEELFFRGVVLEGLISRAGMAPAAAIGLSAVLFGALHFIPDRRLAPFAAWAMVQGVILGTLYVATGSLLAPMLVHGLHDMLGFGLLARKRMEGARGQTPKSREG